MLSRTIHFECLQLPCQPPCQPSAMVTLSTNFYFFVFFSLSLSHHLSASLLERVEDQSFKNATHEISSIDGDSSEEARRRRLQELTFADNFGRLHENNFAKNSRRLQETYFQHKEVYNFLSLFSSLSLISSP